MFWAFFCATVKGLFLLSSALGSCRDGQKVSNLSCNHPVALRCKEWYNCNSSKKGRLGGSVG